MTVDPVFQDGIQGGKGCKDCLPGSGNSRLSSLWGVL